MKKHLQKGLICFFYLLLLVSAKGFATTFYSQGSVAPNLTGSWNTVRAGGGATPGNFTAGDTFVIQNGHTMTTSGTWSVSGTGSKVQIESGGSLVSSNVITLAATTTFQIDNGGSYNQNVVASMGSTTLAGTEVFGASSNFTYTQPPSGTSAPTSPGYGNLIINMPTNSGNFGWGGNITQIQGDFNVTATGTGVIRHALTAGTNITVSVGGNFNLSGTNTNFWLSSAAGTCALTVAGNLNISGSALLDLANAGGAGTLNLGGNFNQTGGTFTSGSAISTVNFTGGTSAVTLTKSGGTFTSTNINWTVASGKTLANNSNNTIVATSRTMTVNGTFQINQGSFSGSTGTWSYGAGATLIFNHTAGTYGSIDGSHTYWPASNSPTNVTIANNFTAPNGISLGVARTVSGVLQTAAGITNANNLTINGTLQINGGGFLIGTPTYGASSTLIYNTTSYTTSTNEFPNTGVKNVTITSPSTNIVTLDNDKTITGTFAIGAHTVTGGKSIDAATITIGAGTLVAGTLTTSSAFTCSGNSSISLSGSWNVAGFTRGTSTVNFTGSGNLNANSTFHNLTNSGGTRSITSNFSLANTLLVSGGDMRVSGGSGKTLTTVAPGNAIINITTGSITGTDAGSGNDLTLQVSFPTVFTGNATSNDDHEKKFYNVTVATGSSLFLSRGILCRYGTFTVNGTLIIASNGYVQSNPTSSAAAAYNASTGTLTYQNGGNYTIGAEWPSSNSPATVNLSAVGTNIILTGNRTVGFQLGLYDGNITTGANTLFVSNNDDANAIENVGTSGYVIGNLRRAIATGSGNYSFPVGTAAGNSKVTLQLLGVTGAGNITVNSNDGVSPNYPAQLSATKRLARYWNVTNSGVTGFTLFNSPFNFLAGDLAGGATGTALKVYKFDAPSTYSFPSSTNSSTQFVLNGLTSFSEFGAGECDPIVVNAITGGGAVICGTSTQQLASTTPGGVWSTDNALTASVDANGLVSGVATGTTTIRYTVTNGAGCSGQATQSVTVDAPAAPTGSLTIVNSTCASLCTVTGGSIALGSVSGLGGTLEYSTDNGASWSATLPTYNAPQTILASIHTLNDCRSTNTSVGSTVAGTCTTPAAPTGSLSITDSTCASLCTVSGGSIALGTVSGPGGTVEYSTDNGSTWSATLPTYNAPQTIVASVINAGGCRSTNTAVGSTVAGTCTTPATPTINAGGPTTFCAGGSVLLTSSAGTSYLWSNSATTQSITATTSGNYTVQVGNASGCLSLASLPVTVTVTAQPLWYLDADNDLYYTGAAVPSCTSPGAGYTTTVTGGGDCADGNSAINPGVTEVCYNNIDDNCNLTLSEGCVAVPVNMTASYNGTTLPSLSTAIPAVAYSYLSETNLKYRFSITNTTTGVTSSDIIQTSRYVTIPAALHSSPGVFTIKASAVINDEVVAYAGNTITVNAPVIPKVTLAPGSCGATLAALTSTLTANAGQNATGYTFRIRLTSDNGPTPTYGTSSSSTRFVSANSFTGFPLSYGTNYQVSVQYTYTDPVTSLPVQSGYGAECTVITPSIPTTYLASPTCGSQVATLNANISAAAASYAVNYQFRIRLTSNVGGPYTESAPNASRFSSLTAFGLTLAYNTQYSISVRYSVVVNGSPVYSNYGPECIVKTPFFPTTSLVQSQCGLEAATTLTQQLNIIPYQGFPNYKVRLQEVVGEDLGEPQDIVVTYPYFKLSQFSTAELGKNYNISVAIKLGNVFGDFSTECDIHTPAPAKTVKMPFTAVAYPNPFANNFMLDVKTTSQSSVNLKVYDMVGRLIEQRDVRVSDMETTTIGERYPSGVYNVVVSQEDSLQTVRVVKR